MMDSGVSNIRSIGVVRATPITVVTMDAIAAKVTQLPMDSDSLSRLPAP